MDFISLFRLFNSSSVLVQFLRNLVLTRFNYLPAKKKLVLRVPTYDRKKSAINCGQTIDMTRLLNTSNSSGRVVQQFRVRSSELGYPTENSPYRYLCYSFSLVAKQTDTAIRNLLIECFIYNCFDSINGPVLLI